MYFFKLFYVLLYKLTCSMLNINIHMNIYVVCIFLIYYEYIKKIQTTYIFICMFI